MEDALLRCDRADLPQRAMAPAETLNGWDAQVGMRIGLPLKGSRRIQLPSQAFLACLLLAGSQVYAVGTM